MKPESDEILIGVLRNVGARSEHHTHSEIVYLQRAALKAAGFAIVLDEAQLLEKGGEVKLHE